VDNSCNVNELMKRRARPLSIVTRNWDHAKNSIRNAYTVVNHKYPSNPKPRRAYRINRLCTHSTLSTCTSYSSFGRTKDVILSMLPVTVQPLVVKKFTTVLHSTMSLSLSCISLSSAITEMQHTHSSWSDLNMSFG
jgi:hypothetical protein